MRLCDGCRRTREVEKEARRMRLCDGCNQISAKTGTPAVYVRILIPKMLSSVPLPHSEEAFCRSCYQKYVGYADVSLDPLPVHILNMAEHVGLITDELAEWRKRHIE